MSETQVTVIARCKAKKGLEERVRDEILVLVEPTRAEPGCINYDLHVSADDPAQFVLYENWTSKGELDKHLAMPYLERFKELAEQLLAAPIDIALYEMLSAPEH
ncbi:MAG: putative quinol monooxygenase [Deferrisomatales bacterium]|nr:putative quinol monooxygenase [Deferrisomatales bacterium]